MHVHLIPLLLTLTLVGVYILGCVTLGVWFKHNVPDTDATDPDAGT